MFIDVPGLIQVDKQPLAENLKLNIIPEKCQLRFKAEYFNKDQKTPVDIVVFKWTPRLDKLCLAITVDGREMTTNTNFLIKISYDVIRRQLKISGNIHGREIKRYISSVAEILEIPKDILGI